MSVTCDGCTQMGLCCSFSIVESGTMWILPSHACKFLDPNTKRCTIYKSRFIENPECSDMETMKEIGGMPPKCNYHSEMTFRYETKVASPKNEKRLWKKLRKLWDEIGYPYSMAR